MRKLTVLFLSLAWLGTAGAAEIYCSQQTRDCSDRPAPGSDRVTGTETLHRVDDSTPAEGRLRTTKRTRGAAIRSIGSAIAT